ncbi:MAG: hypothetical protein CML50_13495 [Rhodobacteraceae bacterium]|jgi:hypothetical protein|uniref:Uncharacterized protein n=1 Tax=Salipiger profundus TaxID=1229727 RepID=A0A1U7D6S6_9RHOB|nr:MULTISPECIES: hypothetical protein [Salipiger]APX23839.1 hypothetical protein Ga0080559_TMP3043 [Salipiger profundus]MAB07009.1 hypothetical protein [Paracoccaceae bacterium]GGA18357.1 hypothetical protein GCM10011326_33700 [Salipiger profundus]
MSDPVTNVEIEDVLSSIRRLVSEDTRPKTPAQPAGAGKPDRLVLTPAQRVPEDAHVAQPAPEGREAMDGPVLLTDPEHVPASSAASDGAVSDDEHATADALESRAEPDAAPFIDIDDTDDQDALDRFVEEEVVRTLAAEFRDDEAQASGPEENDRSGPEDAPNVASADGEADRAAVAEAPFLLVPAARNPDADDMSVRSEEPPQEVSAGQSPATRQAEAPGNLSGKIAALEALLARRAGASAMDTEDEGPNAAFVHRPQPPLEWEDHDPEHGPAVDEADASPVGAASQEQERLPATESQTALVDEVQLQQMVSDMIRQELQGALGERITRNVRKLVRREIHRMLLTRDLD